MYSIALKDKFVGKFIWSLIPNSWDCTYVDCTINLHALNRSSLLQYPSPLAGLDPTYVPGGHQSTPIWRADMYSNNCHLKTSSCFTEAHNASKLTCSKSQATTSVSH